jgi:hypothetical protein
MSLVPIISPSFTPYFPDAAIFDGTNDWLSLASALTGAANVQDAFWRMAIKFNGGDGANQEMVHLPQGIYSHDWRRKNTNKHFFYSHDTPISNFSFNSTGATTITVSTGWHHLMLTIDGSAGTIHHYLNDASDSPTNNIVNTTMSSAMTGVGIGAYQAGGNKANASFCDLIYAQEFIDISDTATRRNFINADGTLPDWETALAAVSTPLLALHLDDGEAAANFANNADGTGQALTVNGTLTSENGPNG